MVSTLLKASDIYETWPLNLICYLFIYLFCLFSGRYNIDKPQWFQCIPTLLGWSADFEGVWQANEITKMIEENIGANEIPILIFRMGSGHSVN